MVALKCDLRKRDDADDDELQAEKAMINYDDGLKVAEKIKALRYLGKSKRFHEKLTALTTS